MRVRLWGGEKCGCPIFFPFFLLFRPYEALRLDSFKLCVILCCMKIITVREAQHNLASVLRRVEQGEEIEVVRRKKPVARIVPVRSSETASGTIDWSDLPDRLGKIWKGGAAKGESTDAILDDLRGDR